MRLLLSIIALLYLVTASAGPILAGPLEEPAPITIRVVNDPGCLGAAGTVTVDFAVETSLTDIDYWYWDFGDDQDSNSQSPSHQYTSAGSFTVSLTVASPSIGPPYTVVAENLVQINDLLFQDDFETFTYTQTNWVHFKDYLWDGTAIEFTLAAVEEEIPADPLLLGKTNGDIICLGPGGGRPFDLIGESNGQFRLDLELRDSGNEELEFTALRLLNADEPLAAVPVVNLRVRKFPGRFDVQIVGATSNASEWIRLSNGPDGARLQVELDWYSLIESYEIVLEAKILDQEENGNPVHLLTVIEPLAAPPTFDALLLGVIGLDTASSQAAGRMRVDNFRACRLDYRPNAS